MSITSAIVLYAVTWFMTLFVVLPISLSTQGDEDHVLRGTHAGSPARLSMKRKFLQTTIWGTLTWAVITAIILSGWISVRDFDFFGVMDPPSAEAGDRNG